MEEVTRARDCAGRRGDKALAVDRGRRRANQVSRPTEATFRKAADAALRDAKPQSQNGFKMELAKRCLVHALKLATAACLTTRINHATSGSSTTGSPIGRATPRIDGPLKVSGTGEYAADFHFPGMLYAVPVEATIANGRIIKLDTAAAEKMPGVRAILHRENIGKIFRSSPGGGFEGICIERRPPFEDDVVRYYGQYVALAVADTFESAKAAADAVVVTYAKEKPNVEYDLKADDDPARRRDHLRAREALAKRTRRCGRRLRQRASQARPDLRHAGRDAQSHRAAGDDRDLGRRSLTIYEESQGVFNMRSVLAQMFGLPKENVRVITKFVGSGFGSKLWPWTHCPLAAAAARKLGKPVKLVLSRKMMFQSAGHRAHTQQRVRLGATPDGKLVSLQHDYVYHRAMLDDYHEDCGEATAFHYSVPNLRVHFGRAKRNIGTPIRHARPGRGARTLCNRVGHERTGRPAQDRSRSAPHSQRAEDR